MELQEKLKRIINNDPVKLIESIFRVRDNKGRLKDYIMAEPHKQMMRTGILGNKTGLSRIIDKGRQLGFSIYQAIEATTIAQIFPTTNQYYIATKEQQAKNWLKKVERIAKDARVWIDGSNIIDIDTVNSSLLEKAFRQTSKDIKDKITSSYIVGLSASPAGAQGETAINVILDEFAWMIQRKNQQREIYEAVKYFISQGGQLTIQSTPVVSTDLFWKIYSNAKKLKFKAFYFPTIENWKELDLNVDLRDQDCHIPYPWVNINELEKARRDDIEFFKQRNLGIPIDDTFRFLSPNLVIPQCTATEEWNGDTAGYYGMAIDVAQERDLTAITVGRLEKGNVVEEIFVTDMNDDYQIQADKITDIIKRYPSLAFCAIDVTGGHGRGIADILKYKVSVPIKKCDFSSRIKIPQLDMSEKLPNIMAIEFKKALTINKYHLIENQQALQHCYNVEKLVTDTKTTKYSGKKNGRDDHFWSKCMLNYYFMQNRELFSYTATGGKTIQSTYTSRRSTVNPTNRNGFMMF